MMYITMPKILLAVEIILGIIGILLLCYSAKLLHEIRNTMEVTTGNTKVNYPLIDNWYY